MPRQGRVGVGYSAVYGLECEPADEPSLTVAELDAAITEIEGTTGSGSAGARRGLLLELLGRATAPEQAFVRRLFTGGLRQGALAGLMVDAVAKAAGVPAASARRALMLSGDLPRVAEIAMAEGEDGLLAVGFELFQPVLPMLASSAETVAAAVASFERASVEWKLDGIRIQLHRRGGEARVYTRNLNDVTAELPGIVEAALALPVSTAGRGSTARRLGGARRDLFDVLHADGDDLLDTPLAERAARLAAIARRPRRAARRSPPTRTRARRCWTRRSRPATRASSSRTRRRSYGAGRRGKSWLKVKPVRTYDLVVLGAEWGHGRRQGRLSNLHLGARDPATGGFVMVGKTFKGMTDELLAWQTEALLARETAREGIAVLVRPELVVEIALDGVQSSTRYPGGVALRFARVKRYRPDKSAAEADTIADLRALLPS